ncbi:hypothetical protein N665_0364s0002 [Sinapis alba]|nr:hypothetical protein N665_0364s0002 [Sinapis alba]
MGSLKSLTLFALLLSFSLGVFAETSNDAAIHAKDEVKPSEATDAIEPQQRGGCRYGCCGASSYGRCSACCTRPQAVETTSSEVNDVEPQQRGRGGCRYGCCGYWRYGRCSYCCRSAQAESEVVEPQQRGGCRYGCCGSYAHGQCSACCSKKMATEEGEQKEEAKP